MTRQCDRNANVSGNVLLVDSEVELLEALRIRLAEESIRVIPASSAQEALDVIDNDAIDIAIIDPNLDDMNGIKLGEIIRARAHAQILFLTSSSTKDYEKVALAVGAMNVLSKRTNLDDLITQIQLSIKSAVEYTNARHLNATLVRKLNEKQRRENLIGAYMEIWGEDKRQVKATLDRFARSRGISLNTLAKMHEEHSKLLRKAKEDYSKHLDQICPTVLRELRIFYDSQNKTDQAPKSKESTEVRAQQS